MQYLSILLGVYIYEFRMQIRRKAVWVTILLIACLLISFMLNNYTLIHQALPNLNNIPLLTTVAYWANITSRVLPLGVGLVLADRLPRDQRTRVSELLTSMPGPLSCRLIGKYLGSLSATLMPLLLFYGIGVGYILYQTHNIMTIPLALETFAVISLPGLLFVGAFSLACPAIMWVPLYQFCLVGYWFWGNELSPNTGIPTLNRTILTPNGQYMAKGIYNLPIVSSLDASQLQGVESILLLTGLAAFALVALWAFLRWQQVRQ